MTESKDRTPHLDIDIGGGPSSQAFQDRHQAALRAHLDRHFSAWQPAKYALIGLAGLIGCLVCGSLAMTEPETTSPVVRGLLALFACFGLGWMILAGWAMTRGQGGFLPQRTVAARMAFGFTLATVVALSLATVALGRATIGMPMLATGLALLVLAAVILIDRTIERSESTIREQLLRLECRMIDLAEAVEKSRGL